jgi:tetratricopeptide (TPR) repeat protein
LPIEWRIENAIVSYVAYLGQMFWPIHLAPFYPHPESTLSHLAIIVSALLLVATTAIVFRLRKQHPYLVTGWLWYAVMLLPVIGIIQVGWQARADRYTYLPQIGLCLALTWLVVVLSAKWRRRRVFLSVMAAAAMVGLICCAWIQTSYWKNSDLLWTHTLQVTKDNDVAHNNLGSALLQRGLIDEALPHFEIAANLRPGNAVAQDNLARIFRRKGRIAEAITHSVKLIELQPNNVEGRDMLGALLLQAGNVEDAIAQWRSVLEIRPDSYAQNSLAWVLSTYPDGRIRDGVTAVKLAQQAVDLSGGDNPVAIRTLAAAYAESGDFPAAIQNAQRGLELAAKQNDSNLIEQFQREIGLYRDGSPLRASGSTVK